MSAIEYLEALKAIVEAPGFEDLDGLERSLNAALLKAVAHLSQKLSSPEDKKIFDLEWIKGIGQELSLKATGRTRDAILKDLLLGVYLQKRHRQFWHRVDETRRVEQKKRLEDQQRLQIVQQSVDGALKALSSSDNKKAFTVNWFNVVAERLQIKIAAKKGPSRFKEGLQQIFLTGQDSAFWKFVEERKREVERDRLAESAYSRFGGPTNSRIFSEVWLRDVCKELGVNFDGKTRAARFKEALKGIYRLGREDAFFRMAEDVRNAFAEEENRKRQIGKKDLEELREIYSDLCSQRTEIAGIEKKLRLYFPDDENFEKKLKRFLKQFGIRARKANRNTWLRKIAEELFATHTAAAGLEA